MVSTTCKNGDLGDGLLLFYPHYINYIKIYTLIELVHQYYCIYTYTCMRAYVRTRFMHNIWIHALIHTLIYTFTHTLIRTLMPTLNDMTLQFITWAYQTRQTDRQTDRQTHTQCHTHIYIIYIYIYTHTHTYNIYHIYIDRYVEGISGFNLFARNTVVCHLTTAPSMGEPWPLWCWGPRWSRGWGICGIYNQHEPLKIPWLTDCYRGLYYLVYWGLW